MRLASSSFDHGSFIPDQYAFGVPGDGVPMAFGANRSPHLAWSDVPAGTRSLALVCVDPDVPSVFDDANQPGRSIARDLRRQDFIHWVLVDIPATCPELATGSCGEGVVPGGKQHPPGPAGSRQGVNDYGAFMGDGNYHGYDGPCPPWNDERLHHYHFRLYALDVPTLGLSGSFTAKDALSAMEGHVLAMAEHVGAYSLNPQLRP
jgi:Raf kinase inhibitor-like YbhB/YbcL family protein